ncbi:MATE efflux family protein [Methanosalsum zhilinae DSM 4017]|uniref:Multidrug export protein MepA n=1 Tax=Methanosalsum zhilinae (strain DSM 4017 / NBRC 107636 / OCM 62 / WeN5) TaxID=679901 RepID=F7XPU4_METZD|nr:MATE family efflux transporter [Methanosalsum zhilinae]AEH61465.1 MATE efflux family protein [Methanosalsum zhilinae DSM 4017]
MDRTEMLGQENVKTLIIRLATPAIIGLMVQAIYNLVDTIFIGRGLGEDSVLGIAGISVAFPVQMLMMAIALGVGIGGASVISRSLGSGRREYAERTVGNMVTMILFSSLVFTALAIYYIEPILTLFGASETVLPFATDYTYYILLGTVFFTFSAAMSNAIRAEGNTIFAMMILVVSSVANIILNPLFIFELGMGIKGAAIATVISQIIGTLMVLYYYFSGRAEVPFYFSNLAPHTGIIKESSYIGTSESMFNVVESLLFLLFNQSLLHYGGDLGIAVFGIVIKVFMLTLMPIIGLKQAIQPIFGYNYGATNYLRIRQTMTIATYMATALCFLSMIIVFLIPEQIIGLFSNDPDLIEMGVPAIIICYLMMPFIGVQIIATALLQSLGKSLESLVLILSRQVIFLPPLVLLLPLQFGLTGIWIAFPLSDLLAFVVALFMMRRESKKMEIL